MNGGKLVREVFVTSRSEHKQRRFEHFFTRFVSFFNVLNRIIFDPSFVSENEYLSEYQEMSDNEVCEIEISIKGQLPLPKIPKF